MDQLERRHCKDTPFLGYSTSGREKGHFMRVNYFMLISVLFGAAAFSLMFNLCLLTSILEKALKLSRNVCVDFCIEMDCLGCHLEVSSTNSASLHFFTYCTALYRAAR